MEEESSCAMRGNETPKEGGMNCRGQEKIRMGTFEMVHSNRSLPVLGLHLPNECDVGLRACGAIQIALTFFGSPSNDPKSDRLKLNKSGDRKATGDGAPDPHP